MANKIFSARVLFLLVVLFPIMAAGEGRFELFEFKLKDEISDVINEDLDNDGLQDLVVIRIDKNADPPGRFLDVYLQEADKGFDQEKKIAWRFPKNVGAIDVGDVAPDPGNELVFITEEGVSYARVSEDKVSSLKLIFKTQSVVAIAYDSNVPYYNFVRDYTGDGRDDIMVCGFYDAVIARQAEDYKFVMNKINLRPGMNIDAFDMSFMTGSQEHPLFRVAYYVPRVFSEDYNGDGRIDLIANFREEVLIFEQGPDGFSAEPAVRFRVKLFEKEESSRRGNRNFPNLEFKDLDEDGKVDLVSSQVQGEFGSMKSRTVVFMGSSKGMDPKKPDMEFKTNKAAFGLYLRDVNKDGKLDIIIPTFDMSAWTAGKAIVTGDVTVEWLYFLQRPDRRFNDAPDRVTPTNLKFNIGKFKLDSGIPNVFGDFNGDGYPDQALGEDKEVLVITLRDGEGNPLKITERIAVPVSIVTRAVDLDNDGLSDLVIHYMEEPKRAGELRVFINRGPWTTTTNTD